MSFSVSAETRISGPYTKCQTPNYSTLYWDPKSSAPELAHRAKPSVAQLAQSEGLEPDVNHRTVKANNRESQLETYSLTGIS